MNADATPQLEDPQPLHSDDLLPILAQQVPVRRLNVARWIRYALSLLMVGAGLLFFGFADKIAKVAMDNVLKEQGLTRREVDQQWLKETEERMARALHLVGALGAGAGLAYAGLGFY